ncbi:hypothetical protein MPSEU_000997800 [Mayamaea pseudoterrestris]|nr:hypothetical protein MPSEU_000997800 [Mayamaea pseudoterrestris]
MNFCKGALTLLLVAAEQSKSAAFGISKTTASSSSRRQRSFGSVAAAAASSVSSSSSTCSWKHQLSQAKQSNVCRYRGGGGTMSQLSTTALSSSATAEAAEATKQQPTEIFRKDYKPVPYTVSTVNLDFDIRQGKTTVTTKLSFKQNPVYENDAMEEPLVLDGDETSVKLLQIHLNGKQLVEDVDYKLTPGKLTLLTPRSSLFSSSNNDHFVIDMVSELIPEENTKLSGLYYSEPMYCTQCEAQGFRRITYYLDRPDVMAVFERVRLEADADAYPVLLSNGNLLEQGVMEEKGRHFAVWSDPFPKPSYLFAAVAGKLGSISDTFTTMSGRKVDLQLFSEANNVGKLHYAMDSLKRSMKWDEDRFGLEYDLDLYNIVAVDSFNMGAMENKGLNVFNTAYVLADEKTATDTDFERVEGVIGHEYFHNWTGNRVTCKSWFELTLKEGLTVFRDQEFSGDMNSKAVNRIENVRGLRARQFAEDAGPMSHPIRPESYISMDNFYTATVYTKGAEVIRMYQTLLTPAGFNKGMELYFERHDGSAVTCDDFLAAMADANGKDLSQFARWYSTPGTPTVKYTHSFEDGTFTLTLSQESNSARGPLLIPVSIGLIDKVTGEEVVPTTVLELKESTQTFTFDGLKNDVMPSLLRDFSAPVKLIPDSGVVDEKALAFLAARDTDGFNRWEAGQILYTNLIFQTLEGKQSAKTLEYAMEAFGRSLTDKAAADYSIQAYNLILPSESTLAEDMVVVDPIGLHKARGEVKKAIARRFGKELKALYDQMTADVLSNEEFKVDAEAIGRRRLRNVLLEYLCCICETDEEQEAAAALAMNHFQAAKGMTDKMAGLNALASMDGRGAQARDDAMKIFYDDAAGDALVLNKWFSVQALADLDDVLHRVRVLLKHPDFTLKNPNRCRSLVGAFAMNSAAFHAESGDGYKFLGEILVELDKLNPQISSRLATNLIQWKRYDEKRAQLMKTELEKLTSLKLSDDLFEIVSRGLK